MTFNNDRRGPSNFDSDLDNNDMVQTYAQYVHDVARQEFPFSVGYEDYDDLAQDSLLKLHLIPHKEAILSPRAYIRQLVHRQAIDMRRKDKVHQLFLTDDEEELCRGTVIVSTSEEYANPEEIVIEREQLKEALLAITEVVCKLHPRQKRAAACTLSGRADVPGLERLLQAMGVSDSQWPKNPQEKQTLQSSYAPVLKKFAAKFGVEHHKRKRHTR